MASLEAISSAINFIPAKKEDLRKAFVELQAHSSSLSSFTLQWNDIQQHLDSIERSIKDRFNDLKGNLKNFPSQPSITQAQIYATPTNQKSSATKVKKPLPTIASKKPVSVKVEKSSQKSKLIDCCKKMDVTGLRRILMNANFDLASDDLSGSLKSAPDPVKLFLDAYEGFFSSKVSKNMDLIAVRRACLALLEDLVKISPEINDAMKERARKIASGWRRMITSGCQSILEILCFLKLVAVFDLFSSFSNDQLLDPIIDVSRRKQIIDFCQSYMPAELIPRLIHKMIAKGKQIDAVKYVCVFELKEEFPPVPLLEAHLSEAKQLAKEVRERDNGSIRFQNEALAKEMSAINAAIKAIDEHNLGSEISRDNLEKQISELKRQAPSKKRTASQMMAENKLRRPEPKRATPIRRSFPSLLRKPVRGVSGQADLDYDYSPSVPGLSFGFNGRRSPLHVPPYSRDGGRYDRSLHDYSGSSAAFYPSYRSLSPLY